MNKICKLLLIGGLFTALTAASGCGGDKKPAAAPEPTKKAAAATKTPEKKERIKLYTEEQLKKMTPAERSKAKIEEARANMSPEERHAHMASDKPEHKKFEKMLEEYPHLKWGQTGYNWKKMAVDGECIWNYYRVTSGKERPTWTDDKGRKIEGKEEYKITVLYGACKGQCVIEAKSEHKIANTPETYKDPVIEKEVIVPFDETYIRHNENGKKWVTHEKCGTI